MLCFLEGTVAELNPDSAVISCGGVGYEVSVTPNTVSSLKTGETARLYVTESIGEDHYDLYGFRSGTEKKWFRLLTSVSGVGPKAAMSILANGSTDLITAAVLNSDEKTFTACPGIGKKIAQRIILELKDKIAKSVPESERASLPSGTAAAPQTGKSASDDALAALVVLGYSTSDVVPVLRKIKTDGLNTQEIIREVLRFMV